MPSYNFQPRFGDDVRWSRKRQTIRRRRTRPTKAGETLYLYTGMRTQFCEKLGEARCIAVHPVEIWDGEVKVGPEPIPPDALDEFARADGFADAADFFDFWRKTHDLSVDKPCLGFELIQWHPTRMIRLQIDYLGGLCPVQAKGKIGDQLFYFRARAAKWQLMLAPLGGNPVVARPFRQENWGKFPEAGYMPEATARKIIAGIAREIEEKNHAKSTF